MKNRKIVIITILNIVLAVLFADFLSRLFMPKYTGDLKDGRITAEFYREKAPLDVIFVGTSIVYAGVSPAKLWEDYGYTSYVRANSSQTPWISYYMIKDAIEVNKPKLVMLDIGFFEASDDYYEDEAVRKTFDYMPQSVLKYHALKNTIPEDYEMWDYLIPVFRYHNRWNDLGIEDIKYAFYIPDQTYNVHLLDLRTSEELPEKVSYDEAATFAIQGKSLDYLNLIISMCEKENVDLILFKTPAYNPRWNMAFEEEIRDYAKKSGVTYINYDFREDEIGLNYLEDSGDGGIHLNTYGAEKFTHLIGSDISSMYGYEGHFDDEKIREVWNQKALDYENAKLSDR